MRLPSAAKRRPVNAIQSTSFDPSMESVEGDVLQRVNRPEDLRKLNYPELIQLCQELRAYFIDVVSRRGGHFAAGLGVVELTVAIHKVFNTPHDQLIWDVGHQAYVHKMLTGRKERFEEIRRFKGLSGFPKRAESEYDAFGTGHASTSISAALGMAVADQLKGDYLKQHIAVIGDGALTGGLAFEGLNNAGVSNANLLIVLNDNSISIDPAVGALSAQSGNNGHNPDSEVGIGDGRSKARNLDVLHKRGIKAVNLGYKSFFESLGLAYTGPIDGHDLMELLTHLEIQKSLKGPRVLHIKTVKGKGYVPAELDQVKWHSPGKFDKLTGEPVKKDHEENLPPKYQEVFGHTLTELAGENTKIVGVTPAMPSGSSMNIFMETFPGRGFDVGIAEEHAVTFSAGLATQGLIPFCNIYSTFLQRAYDQVIHDVCLQNLPVIFCIDRAGIVGQDGPTHHGVFDIPFLRAIPNLVVSAPKDEIELRDLMFTALNSGIPFAIRYPRGRGVHLEWRSAPMQLEIGKAEKLQDGHGVAILALGTVLQEVLKSVDLLKDERPGVYNMRFAKPLDTQALDEIAINYHQVVTVEDGALSGGFGSAVLEYFSEKGIALPVHRIGIRDEFVEHGKPNELCRQQGMDAHSIAETLRKLWP